MVLLKVYSNSSLKKFSNNNFADAIIEWMVVDDQTGWITLDNASNNDTLLTSLEHTFKAINILFSHIKNHIQCFPHIVNLACQAVLTSITNTEFAKDVPNIPSTSFGLHLNPSSMPLKDPVATVHALVRNSLQLIECFLERSDFKDLQDKYTLSDAEWKALEVFKTILEENQLQYPTIFRLAMDIIPIQGSAVPCEHVFSSAKETMQARHNKLGADTMEALQMLRFSVKKGQLLNFLYGLSKAEETEVLEGLETEKDKVSEDLGAFIAHFKASAHRGSHCRSVQCLTFTSKNMWVVLTYIDAYNGV
ncbi:HAT family dimerization domain-containing protein [Salix suchowensis]|nr:HAT family dimerization domain-containing protein [Salix suchowensis]